MAPAGWEAVAAMAGAADPAERVWLRGAGLTDREAERPMPAEAVALVASQTQPFTALIW